METRLSDYLAHRSCRESDLPVLLILLAVFKSLRFQNSTEPFKKKKKKKSPQPLWSVALSRTGKCSGCEQRSLKCRFEWVKNLSILGDKSPSWDCSRAEPCCVVTAPVAGWPSDISPASPCPWHYCPVPWTAPLHPSICTCSIAESIRSKGRWPNLCGSSDPSCKQHHVLPQRCSVSVQEITT